MTPLESAVTVPAYFVALVEIHDPAGFQSYHEQFEATLAPFGGRLVSFGATIVPLEGMDGATARAAIVVFPSLQAGRDWFESPAYRKIAPLRQRSAQTRGLLRRRTPRAEAMKRSGASPYCVFAPFLSHSSAIYLPASIASTKVSSGYRSGPSISGN